MAQHGVLLLAPIRVMVMICMLSQPSHPIIFGQWEITTPAQPWLNTGMARIGALCILPAWVRMPDFPRYRHSQPTTSGRLATPILLVVIERWLNIGMALPGVLFPVPITALTMTCLLQSPQPLQRISGR